MNHLFSCLNVEKNVYKRRVSRSKGAGLGTRLYSTRYIYGTGMTLCARNADTNFRNRAEILRRAERCSAGVSDSVAS